MQKRLNIKKFSAELGYSVATVSRALNPQTSHMVKTVTRMEIQEKAAQMNYVPHPGARVLRRSCPPPVAVFLPQKEHIFISEYYSRLLMGIVHQTSGKNQAVHAIAFHPDPDEIKQQVISTAVGCDGIIYLSDPLNEEMLKELAGLHQPFVCVRSSLAVATDADALGISTFGLVESKGMRLAAEHLISLGHRNIAYIGGPMDHRDAHFRMQGFTSELAAHDIPVRPEWCFSGGYSFETGVAAAGNIRDLLPEVTAVACASDEEALGLIQKLASMGIQCPRDLSITGFDDLQMAIRYIPALTTVRQPLLDMSRVAVEMIAELHASKEKGSRGRSRLLEPELIVRETTRAPHP